MLRLRSMVPRFLVLITFNDAYTRKSSIFQVYFHKFVRTDFTGIYPDIHANRLWGHYGDMAVSNELVYIS